MWGNVKEIVFTGCNELCGGVQRAMRRGRGSRGKRGMQRVAFHTIGSHVMFTPHSFAPAGNMMGSFGSEVTTPNEATKNQQLAPAGEAGFKLCEGMEGF